MAHAFDLILSEYAGYTDESILDLTMGRIRQMVDVIGERRAARLEDDRRFAIKVVEAHAKVLGSLLSGVAQSKEAARAILRAVEKISFLDDAPKQLPSTESVLAAFGGVQTDGTIGQR